MPRDPIAASMPEDRVPDSFDAHVCKLIADLGLFGYHPRNSKGSQAGWPDPGDHRPRWHLVPLLDGIIGRQLADLAAIHE